MTVELDTGGGKIADPAQVVLESDPYRRLSYAWHTFTPEWAAIYGISEQDRARFAGQHRTVLLCEEFSFIGRKQIAVALAQHVLPRDPHQLYPSQFSASF